MFKKRFREKAALYTQETHLYYVREFQRFLVSVRFKEQFPVKAHQYNYLPFREDILPREYTPTQEWKVVNTLLRRQRMFVHIRNEYILFLLPVGIPIV